MMERFTIITAFVCNFLLARGIFILMTTKEPPKSEWVPVYDREETVIEAPKPNVIPIKRNDAV